MTASRVPCNVAADVMSTSVCHAWLMSVLPVCISLGHSAFACTFAQASGCGLSGFPQSPWGCPWPVKYTPRMDCRGRGSDMFVTVCAWLKSSILVRPNMLSRYMPTP